VDRPIAFVLSKPPTHPRSSPRRSATGFRNTSDRVPRSRKAPASSPLCMLQVDCGRFFAISTKQNDNVTSCRLFDSGTLAWRTLD